MGHGFHRGEKNDRFGKFPVLAFEKLSHRFVVKNTDRMGENLRRQVEITGFPSDECSVIRTGKGNFVNRFFELTDDVVVPIFVKYDAAIGEPSFEVEAEFRAV